MKKTVSILLSLVLAAAIIPASAFVSSAVTMIKPGDINFDGVVDVGDAILALRSDSGLIKLNSSQRAAGDITGASGVVDSADAVAILRIDAGLQFSDGWIELVTVNEAVTEFNTAINKVKPNASKITLTKEVNSKTGDITGMPSTLSALANSLISANMGEVDVSAIDPATSTEAKNALFPVENETWSSHLTTDDIEDYSVVTSGSFKTIKLSIKADEPSADTAHDYGHNGKVFSVVTPSVITENAGAAGSIIKNVKTGTSNGTVSIVINTATGNIVSAHYYFEWTLSLKAGNSEVSVPFGIEKEFTIAY